MCGALPRLPSSIPELLRLSLCAVAPHQGDAHWKASRTGDPVRDWPHLQMSSFDSPESFWPPVLKELGIRFRVPPRR